MKRCPYCFAPHNRPRAKYCSDEHARRASRHNQGITAGRARAIARVRQTTAQLALRASQWRGVAAGRKSVEELTREVFGVAEIPPFRDPAA